MEQYSKHFTVMHFMRDEYHDLMVSKVFRNFAVSLVAIFVPIYLLKLGFSLEMILLYELVMLVAGMLFHYMYNYLFSFFGIKKIIIWSYCLSLLYFAILYTADFFIVLFGNQLFIIILALLVALYGTGYWLSYHNYFVHISKNKDTGKKFGLITGIPILTSISAPFIGGVFISSFGFQGAFFMTIFLLLFGGISLSFTKEITVVPETRISKIIDRKNTKRNMIYVTEGFIIVAPSLVWPVLLYFLDFSITVIGGLYFASNIINAVLIIWVGKQVDNKNYSFVPFGALGYSASLFFRAIVKSTPVLGALQFFGGLAEPFWSVPMHALTYKKIKKHNKHLILTRELYMHIGRITAILILFAAITIYPPTIVLSVGLIVAAMGALFIPVFLKELY